MDLKIRKIQDALVEWHAASQIVSSNCQTSVYHAAEKFHTWHQTVPSISCWLANEARVRSTIYASASMIGMQEEILAQQELKKQLQVISMFIAVSSSLPYLSILLRNSRNNTIRMFRSKLDFRP